MPNIEANRTVWQEQWDWSREGEEWSDSWGGTPALWFGALLPRIHTFVPTGAILEIAPGFGRWTQYLKDLCRQLVVVDLADKCIDHCRRRFATAKHIEYHVTDGRSLAMVPDRSIDFVFSFDSLVHAEPDVVESYLQQLARKLTTDGVGFIHHSNMGRYPVLGALARRVPRQILPSLIASGLAVDVGAWRAPGMTARRFAGMCEAAGLVCLAQEEISWERGPYLIDSLSLFTVRGSRWERTPRVTANRQFRRRAREMAQLYSRSSFGSGA